MRAPSRPPSLLCPVSSLCARCWPLLRIAIACFALRSRLRKAILEPVLFAGSSFRGAMCVRLSVGIRTVLKSVCDRAQCGRSMSCRVYCAFKEAHHRTARRRRSECASRVRAMLYGRRSGLITVNKYLPTWSWGGSSGTFFGTLQKWIDLDELSQMAPVP